MAQMPPAITALPSASAGQPSRSRVAMPRATAAAATAASQLIRVGGHW